MAVLHIRMTDITVLSHVDNAFISGVRKVVGPEIVDFNKVSAPEDFLKFLIRIVQGIK